MKPRETKEYRLFLITIQSTVSLTRKINEEKRFSIICTEIMRQKFLILFLFQKRQEKEKTKLINVFVHRCAHTKHLQKWIEIFLVFCQADIHEHLSQRRSSYNIEYGRPRSGASGSASKVDLLKSALEINHKASNNSVVGGRSERTSNPSLNRYRADSAPKLSLANSKTLIIPSTPVLEVSNQKKIVAEMPDELIKLTINIQTTFFFFVSVVFLVSSFFSYSPLRD